MAFFSFPSYIPHKNPYVALTDYYKKKYGCRSSALHWSIGKNDILEFIKSCRQESELFDPSLEYRKVLFSCEPVHAAPLLYIRKNSKESLVDLNSVALHSRFQEIAQIHSSIQCFDFENQGFSKTIRQIDSVGCFTDAIVMIRETTGKDAEGKYFLPDIVDFFEKNSEKQSDNSYKIHAFPPTLMVVVQNSDFLNARQVIDDHRQEKKPDIVRRKRADGTPKTMRDFYQKYWQPYCIDQFNRKPGNAYLKTKYSNIHSNRTRQHEVILGYHEMLAAKFGRAWTEECSRVFAIHASAKFKQYGRDALHLCCEDLLHAAHVSPSAITQSIQNTQYNDSLYYHHAQTERFRIEDIAPIIKAHGVFSSQQQKMLAETCAEFLNDLFLGPDRLPSYWQRNEPKKHQEVLLRCLKNALIETKVLQQKISTIDKVFLILMHAWNGWMERCQLTSIQYHPTIRPDVKGKILDFGDYDPQGVRFANLLDKVKDKESQGYVLKKVSKISRDSIQHHHE